MPMFEVYNVFNIAFYVLKVLRAGFVIGLICEKISASGQEEDYRCLGKYWSIKEEIFLKLGKVTVKETEEKGIELIIKEIENKPSLTLYFYIEKHIEGDIYSAETLIYPRILYKLIEDEEVKRRLEKIWRRTYKIIKESVFILWDYEYYFKKEITLSFYMQESEVFQGYDIYYLRKFVNKFDKVKFNMYKTQYEIDLWEVTRGSKDIEDFKILYKKYFRLLYHITSRNHSLIDCKYVELELEKYLKEKGGGKGDHKVESEIKGVRSKEQIQWFMEEEIKWKEEWEKENREGKREFFRK